MHTCYLPHIYYPHTTTNFHTPATSTQLLSCTCFLPQTPTVLHTPAIFDVSYTIHTPAVLQTPAAPTSLLPSKYLISFLHLLHSKHLLTSIHNLTSNHLSPLHTCCHPRICFPIHTGYYLVYRFRMSELPCMNRLLMIPCMTTGE